MEIFSGFSLNELCDVAESCTRLMSVARQVFYYRPDRKKYPLRLSYMTRGENRYNHRRILRYFGDLITEIEMWCPHGRSSPYEIYRAFDLVESYCIHSSLRMTVFLHHNYLPTSAMSVIRRLEGLTFNLNGFNGYELNWELSQCQQLVHLGQPGNSRILDYRHHRFPRLRSLEHVIHLGRDGAEVAHFYRNHKSLVEVKTSIYADKPQDQFMLLPTLDFILDLSHLQSLDIKFVRCLIEDATEWTTLKTLKKLTLHGCSGPIINSDILHFIGSSEILETLVLDMIDDLEPLQRPLARFTSLRKLHFKNGFLAIEPLIQVKLRTLTKLTFDGTIIKDFASISEIVRKYRALSFLELGCIVQFNQRIFSYTANAICEQKRIFWIGVKKCNGANPMHFYFRGRSEFLFPFVKIELYKCAACTCPDCT